MNEYMGWVQGSDMASTYVHLSGRDVDSALLKLNNITVSEEENATNGFSIRTCTRCMSQNPPANKFCSRCGMILDEKTARTLITANVERDQADRIWTSFFKMMSFVGYLSAKRDSRSGIIGNRFF
jgi:ribosomal protein L40E